MHDTEGETIDDVRRQRDELGIQLAACQERLRLAMAVVDAARDASSYAGQLRLDDALAALDAVPGDALNHAAALDRAHEASGVARYEAIANKRDPGPEGVER